MVGTGEIKRSESVSAQFYSFMLLFEHGKLNFLERNFEGLATTIGKANLKSFDRSCRLQKTYACEKPKNIKKRRNHSSSPVARTHKDRRMLLRIKQEL